MANIFVQGIGAGMDNYNHTVNRLNPFNTAQLLRYAGSRTFSEQDALMNRLDNEDFWVWGCTPGWMQKYWDKMQDGDIMIFYDRDRCASVSRIAFKVHDPELAMNLWGTKGPGGPTWEFVFFLTGLRDPRMSKAEVNALLGYNEGYRAEGIASVSESKLSNIMARYGSVDVLYDILAGEALSSSVKQAMEEKRAVREIVSRIGLRPTPAEIDAEIRRQEGRLSPSGSAKGPSKSISLSYSRNYELSEAIKLKHEYACEVCTSTFPKEGGGLYCESHHILPLAWGGEDKEVNIVVVCPTCHRRFHFGTTADVLSLGAAASFSPERRMFLDAFLRVRGRLPLISDD